MPKVKLTQGPLPPLEPMVFPHIKTATADEIAHEQMTARRIHIIGGFVFAEKDGKLFVSEQIEQ